MYSHIISLNSMGSFGNEWKDNLADMADFIDRIRCEMRTAECFGYVEQNFCMDIVA